MRMPRRRPSPAPVALLLALATLPAAAQGLYKIVAPDGTVTYTDRPPPAGSARVQALGRSGAPGASSGVATLPAGLREAVARFPVVLYTVPNCAPCERGRELLRARGIPYEERLADPNSDREAWLRAVGSMEAPGLTVGAQLLRGFNADEWQSTLDLAGYPRTSRRPPNHPPPAVVPLVARRTLPEPVPSGEAPAELPPQPTVPLPGGGGIRF
jgi:glutaredoxin